MTIKRKVIKKVTSIKEESGIDEITSIVTDKVVNVLKPQMKDQMDNMKNDLMSDIKELLERQRQPLPKTEPVGSSPVNMNGIMDMLKDGNIDMGKISQMMGSMNQQTPMPTGADGKPLDMSTLTAGQIEFMKMQSNEKMMAMILPLILQNQGSGQNPMMAEMMNRIFMEKINSSLYMDKVMIQKMAQSIGMTPPPPTGLTTPISDMLNQKPQENKNALNQ